ncbi:hypothetical protein [Compostimonas suwonensis]|nr:hypothetical protein [Compostimonas suwonensis]
MTLIAAVAHDSRISIAADTKVTYEDDAIASARVFDLALPKIVLLRDELAVAISGARPTELIRQLVVRRDQELGEIIEHLRGVEDAGFIVASLGGPSIWTVSDGAVERVAAGELELEGDDTAFDDFTMLFEDSRRASGAGPGLYMAMDSLAGPGPWGRHPSVGGYSLVAATSDDGFRFASRPTTIAPRAEEPARASSGDSDLRVSIRLPAGNSSWYQSLVLGGRGRTPGAVGIFVLQAQAGRLFTHDRPYEGVTLSASDADDFARLARERGQELHLIQNPLPPL